MIPPHGGILIQREVNQECKDEWIKKAHKLPSVALNAWELSDLEMIATGAFSPLDGYMNENDYVHVLETMRLSNGHIWPLPITLTITKDEAQTIQPGDHIALKGSDGIIYGMMEVQDQFACDKVFEAKSVFGTINNDHPGVKKTLSKGDICLGGPIWLLRRPSHEPFEDYAMTPEDARKYFDAKGWKTIVGFQTRNPIHRAHEYIQKIALELVDGLFVHPLVGETKRDDISPVIRMKSYETILERYFPKNRVKLSIFPAAMRYAGPREAVFHALVRKNYGCTHFIVGRDHAGVGDYYGTYDAQNIFQTFKKEEIDIEILTFEHAFYCHVCAQMATPKTCPHKKQDRLELSGTRVRDMLRNGQKPPVELTRPEVAEILIEGLNQNRTGRQNS
ncbi:sulfate adenylyltransferase [Melghiribacillus thermohalophilus]|uniref:Sulfate adenylyltransferase n=1 Tax=Melghiribacillus thermohalophilus TaxID=1324956 RepID=A0A4R3N6X3_9BACI|nr:sulfate adenylyltransferase [Melghiribacillus thermohalophilus]